MADWKGKDYQGTFAGGQGPILGQSVKIEEETKGVFGGEGGGKNLKPVEGAVHGEQGSEDKGFDLHGASYEGPNNKMPEDKGTRNPFDIGHST